MCIRDRYYYVHMDEEMSQEQIREYQALLSKRAERIPVSYTHLDVYKRQVFQWEILMR